jgi:hypothetical protein
MPTPEIVGSNAKEAVLYWRVAKLEETVKDDHEPRLRALETMAAKIAVWAFIGSTLGAALAAGIISYFIK